MASNFSGKDGREMKQTISVRAAGFFAVSASAWRLWWWRFFACLFPSEEAVS